MSSPNPYFDHPLFHTYDVVIQTPPAMTLRETVDRWLCTGATGGVIHGLSRSGKTTALIAIRKNLCARNGEPIRSHFFTVPRRDYPTIKSLYRSLSVSAAQPLKSSSTVEDMMSNLVSYFCEHARQGEPTQFVLIVDDAQRLSISQYNVFTELHDYMREAFGLLLTVIFVVNTDESQQLFQQITDSRYKHIHGRFFVNIEPFRGLRTRREVQQCLSQYDTLRYPEPDGPTFTAFFLPEAAHNGWKYASLSGVFWQTFKAFMSEYGLKEWGMESFMRTTNILLYDFFPQYGVEECDEDMVKEAIEMSGLIPSLVKPCS